MWVDYWGGGGGGGGGAKGMLPPPPSHIIGLLGGGGLALLPPPLSSYAYGLVLVHVHICFHKTGIKLADCQILPEVLNRRLCYV